MDGQFKGVISKKGKGPNQLLSPRSLYVGKQYILIGDNGLYATKSFSKDGQLVRAIILEDYQPVTGDLIEIQEDKILHAGLWDGTYSYESLALLIDTTGKILEKIGRVPPEYFEYKSLEGTTFLDCDKQGNYVITVQHSSALIMGNVFDKQTKTFELSEKREKYVTDFFRKDLRKEKPNEKDLMEAALKVCYNSCVKFLNDTIIVRAYYRPTEEAMKQGSPLRCNHYCEFYTTQGKFLGEENVKGQLREVYNGQLVIEESDEPDNRIFSFYSPLFKFESQVAKK